MFAPYMGLYQEQGRHRDRLPVEDGRHHLAAAPFYFTFEIQQALAACEHVIDDDDSFSPDISRNAVVPFQNALASLALVQALACIRHIHIVKSGGQFRPVGRDVPVKSLETLPVLYPVAARHEHDVARVRIQRQGRHASLEKRNAVVLSLLEGIEGSAELALFFAEQPFVPRRIVVPVERHADAVEAEGLERMPVLEKIGMGEAEHPAGIPVPGHHGQTAVAVTFFRLVRKQGGGKCGIPGLPPPISGQTGQAYRYARQYQEQQPRFHCSLDGDNGYFTFCLSKDFRFSNRQEKPIALTSMDGYRSRSSQNLGTNEWFGLTVFSR